MARVIGVLSVALTLLGFVIIINNKFNIKEKDTLMNILKLFVLPALFLSLGMRADVIAYQELSTNYSDMQKRILMVESILQLNHATILYSDTMSLVKAELIEENDQFAKICYTLAINEGDNKYEFMAQVFMAYDQETLLNFNNDIGEFFTIRVHIKKINVISE